MLHMYSQACVVYLETVSPKYTGFSTELAVAAAIACNLFFLAYTATMSRASRVMIHSIRPITPHMMKMLVWLVEVLLGLGMLLSVAELVSGYRVGDSDGGMKVMVRTGSPEIEVAAVRVAVVMESKGSGEGSGDIGDVLGTIVEEIEVLWHTGASLDQVAFSWQTRSATPTST